MRYLIGGIIALLLAAGCTRPSIEQQVGSLGNREFVPESWAVATPVQREQMLASFFAKHPAQELTAAEVKRLLGAPTGYYDYDENLAYFVGPATVASSYGKERMLVFITDKRTGKIAEVEFVPPLR